MVGSRLAPKRYPRAPRLPSAHGGADAAGTSYSDADVITRTETSKILRPSSAVCHGSLERTQFSGSICLIAEIERDFGPRT
jgi:hypothetical protein